ncbi:MAG TPA: segregation/condensation protein A [Bacteriovoracaceae bacterium]|nr:segregation/condensation protein A [Bacteriovoracaceae bacterium]
MNNNEILVKIDRFDGPLALLLHLVQKEEMRIHDLDLTTITHQYLDYLQKMQDLNFDVAGEYLFMAATLLHIKSQAVADETQNENTIKISAGEMGLEIETRGELIRRLEELERFQRLGQRLWELPKKGHEIFVKHKVDRKAIENSILTPIDLAQLTETMMDLIRREKRKYTVVKRDRLSIKEKLIRLKSMLKEGDTTQFDKLLDSNETGIIDKVITFISLLELARLKKLEIYQNEDKGNIYIEVKESLDNFDVETADGFEPEGEAKDKEEKTAEDQVPVDATIQ